MKISNKLFNTQISLVLLTIGTAVGVAATPASAAQFNLGELISNNESFIVGDKMFSNFSCVKAGTGTPDTCDEINVLTLDDLNYGIQFQTGFNATAGNFVDFLLGYDVMALDPNMWINDIELLFNGTVTFDGLTNVTETVTNLDPGVGPINDFLGQIVVTNPPEDLMTEADLLYKTRKIHVSKDVFLSGGTNGTATISFIDQRFSQVRESVPEPASILGLLAFGSLGIALKRKKA